MPSLTIQLSELVAEPVSDLILSTFHEMELNEVGARIRTLGQHRPMGRPSSLPLAVAHFVEANQPELQLICGMDADHLASLWSVFPVQDDLVRAMDAFKSGTGNGLMESSQHVVVAGCVARVLASAALLGMSKLPEEEVTCRAALLEAMSQALGNDLGDHSSKGALQLDAEAYKALRSALLCASRVMMLLQAWIAPWVDSKTMTHEAITTPTKDAPDNPADALVSMPVSGHDSESSTEMAPSSAEALADPLAQNAAPVALPATSPWADWTVRWLELSQQIILEAGLTTRAVSQRELPHAQISVPVDPPRDLLQGAPLYDNLDLTVRVAPFLAEALRELLSSGSCRETIHPDGRAVTLKAWSQTRDVDLRRLTDLFRNLREKGRQGLQRLPEVEESSDVAALMATLGMEPIPNVAPCWGRRPAGVDLVIGLRSVAHFHDGMLPLRRRLQISVVLGRDLGHELPVDLQDQLMHRGSLGSWSQEGLRFVSIEMEEKPEELVRQTLIAFLDLAMELQETMRTRGLVDGTQLVDWLPRLNLLPMRLETDFPRLRRQWRRRRLAEELREAARNDLASAKRLVEGVEDMEERHHLRAILVTIRAGSELEAAVAELAGLEPGPDRHDALLAVLEACSVSHQGEGAQDGADLLALGRRIFELWLAHDARQESTTWDCLPFLDLVGNVLGLELLFKGWEDELAPTVACDWLIHTLRRSPRSRLDPAWLTKLDQVVFGSARRPWGPGDVNRLFALLETIWRHNLPGHEGLVLSIRDVGKRHPPCQAFVKQRLDELCAGTGKQLR